MVLLVSTSTGLRHVSIAYYMDQHVPAAITIGLRQ